jgi:hypothetical protein
MQKTSLHVNYRCVGSMDQPVWWDEEMAVHIIQRIAMPQEVISYTVRQCLKLEKLHILR